MVIRIIYSETLSSFNFDLFYVRLRQSLSRHGHGQHTFFKGGIDLVLIRVLRKGKHPLERAVGALHPVVVLFLLLLFLFLFAADGQGNVKDADVFFCES